jgi:hypothetical protein
MRPGVTSMIRVLLWTDSVMNDDDHLVAVLLRFHDSLGDALDALGIGYGGASVLLHDKAHVRSLLNPSLHRTTAVRSVERAAGIPFPGIAS